MDQRKSTQVMVPEGLGADSLRKEWKVDCHRKETHSLRFWDSFEWGVWFSGHILYSCGRTYRLCTREDGWLGEAAAEEEATGRRRFWQEFESEPMRAKLAELLGLRGLAPVAEVTCHSRRCEIRDEADKIVCRLVWSTLHAGKGGEQLLRFCQVLPLLGYEDEAQLVLEQLTVQGALPLTVTPMELLLQQAGRVPERYTLRPSFGLTTETPARAAVGRIVRTMLEIADSNMPGLLDDLDTEFLHDYRICLRKMRSALGLLKGVYPPEATQRMRSVLGELAHQTNRLRDLDVYLLAREEYLGLIPPGLRPALDGMFKDFAAERRREVKRVFSALRGPAHQRQREELAAFFAQETLHEPSPAAGLPVGPRAFSRIHKRYRKIRRIAAQMGAETPDAMVHQLRIQCKKLRYLMEFFSEIIPAEEGAEMIKMLRRLQNRLGKFNDASVQQKSLMEYWRRKKPGSEASLGVGGLISMLYHRQQQARGLIEQELELFCHGTTAGNFKKVFKTAASAAAAPRSPQP